MKKIRVNLYNYKYAYNEVLIEKQDLIDIIQSNGFRKLPISWTERIY